MGSLLQRLKPTDRETREMALRETDPEQVERFEPIALGPLFALVAVPVVLLMALPSIALRLLRSPPRGEPEEL